MLDREHEKFVFEKQAEYSGVMYVAKFEEAIYVLHCFQKKTEATSKSDKDIADARYRAMVQKRKTTK